MCGGFAEGKWEFNSFSNGSNPQFDQQIRYSFALSERASQQDKVRTHYSRCDVVLGQTKACPHFY